MWTISFRGLRASGGGAVRIWLRLLVEEVVDGDRVLGPRCDGTHVGDEVREPLGILLLLITHWFLQHVTCYPILVSDHYYHTLVMTTITTH